MVMTYGWYSPKKKYRRLVETLERINVIATKSKLINNKNKTSKNVCTKYRTKKSHKCFIFSPNGQNKRIAVLFF